MLRRLAPALSLCLVAASSCAPSPGLQPLRLGVLTAATESEFEERYGPLEARLDAALEPPVSLVPYRDPNELLADFAALELAGIHGGAIEGIRARRTVAGAAAVAWDAGAGARRSYFLARRDAELVPTETLSPDLFDLTFAFGPDGSAGARWVPEIYLREVSGAAPVESFGTPPLELESEAAVWLAVQEGTVQSGALDSRVFDRDLAAGAIDPLTVAVVWATPDFVDEHWTLAFGATDLTRALLAEEGLEALPEGAFEPLEALLPR